MPRQSNAFVETFFLIPLLHKYLQFNNTTKPNSSLNFHISSLKAYLHKQGLINYLL